VTRDPERLAATRVGVDTGGTFTDVVAADGTVVKLPSTPSHPAQAVADGVRQAVGESPRTLAHGTTVATNALLERRGGRVALVGTAGHVDEIEIARQSRPSLYDLWADRPSPLVARSLRLEVAGRLDGAGHELEAVGEPPEVPDGVDAVAVCLLHSDLNDAQERRVEERLSHPTVVRSSAVSPEYREYERAVTTVANAYLLRPCRAYLAALAELAEEVLVMTSAGGLVPLDRAADLPVRLLLSGPAGGVRAAAAAALAAGWQDCVTFDMGGTSTDVCLVQDGRPAPAAQRTVAGLPVRVPALDVHTIGAGGGSLARVDPGGALRVGPQSAGAEPGPACYGRGGRQPTVTDADLVAGRIPAHGLPGLGRLSRDAADQALHHAGVEASGVIAVVDAAMVEALRTVSVARGVDPSGLALVAFGGAGPLHACALADALGMPAVIVPPRAGVLSAAGILGAPRQEDRVRSWSSVSDHQAATAAVRRLGDEAASALGGSSGVEVDTALDCRYRGQSHELTVPSVAEFPVEHRRRNGFAMDAPVEVVALRASARRRAPLDIADLAAPDRQGRHRGPTLIAETDCTIWVGEGWRAGVHQSGSWLLTREAVG
jgi:N-methylhydantoinase A/oxoprolinase/acetone carboxylase beta subunit